MAHFRPEVLIFGGGVQGLWILHTLYNQGYRSVVLLENELLGCQQTCHSHAFLHQGPAYYERFYPTVSTALFDTNYFADAWLLWQNMFASSNIPLPKKQAYHAFCLANDHRRAVNWGQVNQQFRGFANYHFTHPEINPQVVAPTQTIQTDEICFPADRIAQALSVNKDNHVRRIRSIVDIQFSKFVGTPGNPAISQLTVDDENGNEWVFDEPKCVILAAGIENKGILRLMGDKNLALLPTSFSALHKKKWDDFQFESAMDMLLVRASKDDVPDYCGSLFGYTVQNYNVQTFLVSREPGGDELVWVFSGKATDGRSWIKGPFFRQLLAESMRDLFSKARKNFSRLRWGSYRATMVTFHARSLPSGLRFTHPKKWLSLDVENLRVVYPDRMTIAPLAASELVNDIALLSRLTRMPTNILWPPPGVAWPPAVLPAVDQDRWKKLKIHDSSIP